jgi:hypothetical protein
MGGYDKTKAALFGAAVKYESFSIHVKHYAKNSRAQEGKMAVARFIDFTLRWTIVATIGLACANSAIDLFRFVGVEHHLSFWLGIASGLMGSTAAWRVTFTPPGGAIGG